MTDFNHMDLMPPRAFHVFHKVYKESQESGFSQACSFANAYAAIDGAGFKKGDNGLFTTVADAVRYGMTGEMPDNDNEQEEESGAPPAGVYSSVKPDPATAKLLSDWIAAMGIPNPVPAEKLHSTILFSRTNFAGYQPRLEPTIVRALIPGIWEYNVPDKSNYSIRRMGKDQKAVALCFSSSELSNQFWIAVDLGAAWDFDDKVTHITLSYDCPEDFNLGAITLPDFDLSLEAEVVEPLVEDWSTENGLKKSFGEPIAICKVDEAQHMVYGWASVISKNGCAVVDFEGDVIEEADLIKAAHEFMAVYRDGHEMHSGISKGGIVESVVFTKELQTALGIDLGQVGWFIGYHVDDSATWDRVQKGELREFSIGGSAVREPIK